MKPEIEKAAREKDEISKKLREDQDAVLRDKLNMQRAQLTKLRTEMDQDKLLLLFAEGKTLDERGNEISLWDQVRNLANRALGAEQNAYNDWRSAIMSLVSMYSELLKAIHHSIEELTAPAMMQLKQLVREKIFYAARDAIIDKLNLSKEPLGQVIYDVRMGKDNKLCFGEVSTSNNMPVSPEVTKGVHTLIALWLADRGYVLKKAASDSPEDIKAVENCYVKIDDPTEPLTENVFNNLKELEEGGFKHFLNASHGAPHDEQETLVFSPKFKP